MLLNEIVVPNPITTEMMETKSVLTAVALRVVEQILKDLGPTVMVYGSRAFQVYTDSLLADPVSDWDVMTWDLESTLVALLNGLRSALPDRSWTIRQRLFSVETFEIVSHGTVRGEMTINNVVDVTVVPDAFKGASPSVHNQIHYMDLKSLLRMWTLTRKAPCAQHRASKVKRRVHVPGPDRAGSEPGVSAAAVHAVPFGSRPH